MANAFHVELSMRQPPGEAQARAAAALKAPAHAVGLRLTTQRAGELSYRPRVQFPFVLMLWHSLNREQMTITFATAEDGGSNVTVAGAVTRHNSTLAADPEHWADALGATIRG
jgi:hypothetical protein